MPRFYIKRLRDKCIPHSFQKRMYSALPYEKALTIDTDHSPFFSAPRAPAECLCSIVAKGTSVS